MVFLRESATYGADFVAGMVFLRESATYGADFVAAPPDTTIRSKHEKTATE
jgi:hypothetical protein